MKTRFLIGLFYDGAAGAMAAYGSSNVMLLLHSILLILAAYYFLSPKENLV